MSRSLIQYDQTGASDAIRATLDEWQLAAFNAFCGGRSVFVTGSGGSGKSHLIASMVKEKQRAYAVPVAVMAATNTAARELSDKLASHGCAAKATTFHSYLGIGNSSKTDSAAPLLKRRIWRLTEGIMVIDEGFVLPAELLEMMDRECKYL